MTRPSRLAHRRERLRDQALQAAAIMDDEERSAREDGDAKRAAYWRVWARRARERADREDAGR